VLLNINDDLSSYRVQKTLARNIKLPYIYCLKDGKPFMKALHQFNISLVIKDINNLNEGDIVNVLITKHHIIGFENNFVGFVDSYIGHINDPDIEIKKIVVQNGFALDFLPSTLKESSKMPRTVSAEEIRNRLLEGGQDLREEMIFTIDGQDTKDFDDAISLQKLANGNYLLGVHIADVSYYVKEGSNLYNEAMERGTSVYLGDSVIPMLPRNLSNGICSLNPNATRLTKSVNILLDKDGDILSYEIFKSVINSKKRMTYENVNACLKGDVLDDYKPYMDTLLLMNELTNILEKKKINRGYVNFDVDKEKIKFDKDGNVRAIVLENRGQAEKLIENFMLCANEAVARVASDTFIKYIGLPSIYRIHDIPSFKLNLIIDKLRNNGIKIKRCKHDNLKALSKIMDELKGTKDYNIISELLLLAMNRACYATENIGHFGLALDYYTHFTSPIRRFPDLQTHILLDKYIPENIMDIDTVSENARLKDICKHSSYKERKADNAEREVLKLKMAELMSNHIGETFEATVWGISEKFINFKLDNHVRGSLALFKLNNAYVFDKNKAYLIAKDGLSSLKLGAKINVLVRSVDSHNKSINFTLVREKQLVKKYG
jgi:ribonuclease R